MVLTGCLRKMLFSMPEFLTYAQVDRIISGPWNALNSGELQDGNNAKMFPKSYADAKGAREEPTAADWDDYVRGSDNNFSATMIFMDLMARGHRDTLQFVPVSP